MMRMTPLATVLVLCLSATVARADDPSPTRRTPPLAERAVLFYIDGLHPDAIDRLDLPHLKALREAGTSVEDGMMIFPWHPTTGGYGAMHTTSLPNPMTMAGNLFLRRDQPLLQHQFPREAVTAAAMGSKAYASLMPGFSLVALLDTTDAALMDGILSTLERHDPVFFRIQLQDTNRAGMATINCPPDAPHHGDIWHPASPYAAKAREADRQLGRFVAKLRDLDRRESTLFVLMSDGQSEAGWHPPMDEQSWRTPMIFVGPGIRPNHTIPYAEHIDVVPTIAHALGIEPPNPGPGSGRILREIFQGAAPIPAPERRVQKLNDQIKEHLLLTAELRLLSATDPHADNLLMAASHRFFTRRAYGGEPFYGIHRIEDWPQAGSISSMLQTNDAALTWLRQALEQRRAAQAGQD